MVGIRNNWWYFDFYEFEKKNGLLNGLLVVLGTDLTNENDGYKFGDIGDNKDRNKK